MAENRNEDNKRDEEMKMASCRMGDVFKVNLRGVICVFRRNRGAL